MITDKFFMTKPESIKIKDSLPRFRKEMGDVKKLLDSIEKHGQLHPVVVNRNMEIISGGRRLAACIQGGLEVMCAYNDTIDDYSMREIELEENVVRKELTPSEEVLAIKELHTIKQAINGVAAPNKSGGWRLDDTAALLAKTRGSIIGDLALADAIEAFPVLAKCKKKSDIRKAAKAILNIAKVSAANKDHNEFIAQGSGGEQVKLTCENMITHIKAMENESVDLLLTDPPYGINIHDIATSLGGLTGGELNTVGNKYEDTKEVAMDACELLAVESHRVCKFNAHGFIFTAPEHFYSIREIFIKAGWSCYVKPIIWIKGISGQTNMPAYWFASCYEMILYIRKESSRLVLEGKPDWFQCDPVRGREKIHQAEKPVALLKELIARTVLPNSVVYDPFGGSGASMEATVIMKCKGIYCELDKANYSLAVERMKPILK